MNTSDLGLAALTADSSAGTAVAFMGAVAAGAVAVAVVRNMFGETPTEERARLKKRDEMRARDAMVGPESPSPRPAAAARAPSPKRRAPRPPAPVPTQENPSGAWARAFGKKPMLVVPWGSKDYGAVMKAGMRGASPEVYRMALTVLGKLNEAKIADLRQAVGLRATALLAASPKEGDSTGSLWVLFPGYPPNSKKGHDIVAGGTCASLAVVEKQLLQEFPYLLAWTTFD